jgi:hypothetical protein
VDVRGNSGDGTPYLFRGRIEYAVLRFLVWSIDTTGKKADMVRSALPSYSSSSIGTRTRFTVCALPVFSESSEARASASLFAG